MQGNERYMMEVSFCLRKHSGRRDQSRPYTTEQRVELRLVLTSPRPSSPGPQRVPRQSQPCRLPNGQLSTPPPTPSTTAASRAALQRNERLLAGERLSWLGCNNRIGSGDSVARYHQMPPLPGPCCHYLYPRRIVMNMSSAQSSWPPSVVLELERRALE